METDAPSPETPVTRKHPAWPDRAAVAAILLLAIGSWLWLSWAGLIAIAATVAVVAPWALQQRRAERRGQSALDDSLRRESDLRARLASVEAARQRTLDASRDAALREELLWAHGPDMLSLHDANGVFLWLSASAGEILGHPPASLIGTDGLDLIDDTFRQRVRRKRGQRLERGEPFITAYPVRQADGGRIWLESSHRFHTDDQGRRRLLVLSRDITRRRQAERALRDSERLYRAVFETATIGMGLFAWDDNGRCLKANRALCEMLGYSAGELLETHFRELTHPADQEITPAMARELLNGERSGFQVEKRYLRKDGRLIWALVSGSMIHDSVGQPLFITTQIQDISDRRMAEDALARVNREREQILNAAAEGILRTDRNGRINYANRSARELLRLPEEAAAGAADIRSLTPPGSDSEDWPVMESLRNGGVRKITDSYLRRHDGELLPVDYTTAPLIDGGQMRGIVLVFSDMSLVRRLSTQRQIILDAAAEGIYELGRDGRLRYCNKATETLLGYTAAELEGQDMHALVHHSHADGSPYPHADCPTRRTLRTGQVHSMHGERFWRKDGSSFPAELVCAPIIQGGEVQGAVVVFSDISETVAAEARMRQAALDLVRSESALMNMAGLAAAGLQAPIETLENRQEADVEYLRELRDSLAGIADSARPPKPEQIPVGTLLQQAVVASGCPLQGHERITETLHADRIQTGTLLRQLLDILRRSRGDATHWFVVATPVEEGLALTFTAPGTAWICMSDPVTGLGLAVCNRLLGHSGGNLEIAEQRVVRLRLPTSGRSDQPAMTPLDADGAHGRLP